MEKNDKKIWILIIIIIGVSIASPLLLEYLIFRNDFYSVISNEAWSGYIGSILSGTFGGVGTLFAVYITTLETRKIQNDANKKMKYNEDKKYVEDIAEIVTKFITEKHIFYNQYHSLKKLAVLKNQKKNDLYNLRKEKEKRYNDIKKHELDNSYTRFKLVNEIEINKINDDIFELEGELGDINEATNRFNFSSSAASNLSYLLQIKLSQIESAGNLFNKLIFIQDDLNNNELESEIWLDKQTSELIELTNGFMAEYLSKYKK